jgi:hypothetical protein
VWAEPIQTKFPCGVLLKYSLIIHIRELREVVMVKILLWPQIYCRDSVSTCWGLLGIELTVSFKEHIGRRLTAPLSLPSQANTINLEEKKKVYFGLLKGVYSMLIGK